MKGGACDPFAVDEDRWLEALALEWSALYLVSVNDSRWYAIRRDGTGSAFIRDTPWALGDALRAAWLADTAAGAR